jgi:hypothetical protein
MTGALSAAGRKTLAEKLIFCEIKSAATTGELSDLRQTECDMKERVFMVQQELKQHFPAKNEGESRRGDGTPSAPVPVSFWSQFTARVRSWFEVPFGYEDESGFHYGQQPAPKFASESVSSRARVLTDRADQMMRHSVVLPIASTPEPPSQPVAPEKKVETVNT